MLNIMLAFYYLKESWNILTETTEKIFRSNVMGVVQPMDGKILLSVQHFQTYLSNIKHDGKYVEFGKTI